MKRLYFSILEKKVDRRVNVKGKDVTPEFMTPEFSSFTARRLQMKLNVHLKFVLIAIGLVLGGCASYAPSLVKLDPSGPNVIRAMTGDLTVYVDEYATPEKSQRAFDADLAKEGVLPLLISLENNGQQPYEVKVMDIVVRGRPALKGLTPEEAANKAERSAVGRALGWSLIVPIISIPVAIAASAIHTSKVNDQIVRDFTVKSFSDGVIMPNKERSGFLFFEQADGSTDLGKFTLEITAKNLATNEQVTIAAPLPSRILKSETQAQAQEGTQEAKSQE